MHVDNENIPVLKQQFFVEFDISLVLEFPQNMIYSLDTNRIMWP